MLVFLNAQCYTVIVFKRAYIKQCDWIFTLMQVFEPLNVTAYDKGLSE